MHCQGAASARHLQLQLVLPKSCIVYIVHCTLCIVSASFVCFCTCLCAPVLTVIVAVYESQNLRRQAASQRKRIRKKDDAMRANRTAEQQLQHDLFGDEAPNAGNCLPWSPALQHRHVL